MKESQSGNASDKVNTICLVLVKMYGNNPRKLLYRISLNKEMKIIEDPLILGPRSVLNSLCKVIEILFHNVLRRDGINQNDEGIINRPISVLVQLNDVLQLVEGSNDENRLAIIFKKFCI